MIKKLHILLLNILGLILMLGLPALWVAWELPVFYVIFGVIVVAALLYILLYRHSPLDREGMGAH